MRILANENFPADAVYALRDYGHDVVWVRTNSPGISDTEVLDLAQRENRILITFDKDFGELAFRLMLPALNGIILFRMSTTSSHKLRWLQSKAGQIGAAISLWLKIVAYA